MKKVKVTNLTYPVKNSIYVKEKKYWVALGNKVRVSFTNRKNALAFIAQTNRFLNEKTFELNKIYVDIFSEYRRIWFYFDSKNARLMNFEQQIGFLEKRFDLLIDTSSYEDGNYNAFFHIRGIVYLLQEMLTQMQRVMAGKNNYAEKYNLGIYLRRLDDLLQAVNDYANNLHENWYRLKPGHLNENN